MPLPFPYIITDIALCTKLVPRGSCFRSAIKVGTFFYNSRSTVSQLKCSQLSLRIESCMLIWAYLGQFLIFLDNWDFNFEGELINWINWEAIDVKLLRATFLMLTLNFRVHCLQVYKKIWSAKLNHSDAVRTECLWCGPSTEWKCLPHDCSYRYTFRHFTIPISKTRSLIYTITRYSHTHVLLTCWNESEEIWISGCRLGPDRLLNIRVLGWLAPDMEYVAVSCFGGLLQLNKLYSPESFWIQ